MLLTFLNISLPLQVVLHDTFSLSYLFLQSLKPHYLHTVLCVSLSVIATMRDLKKKDKLVEAAGDAYGKTLTLLPLDVCSDESVRQCVNNVKDRHIDILSEWDTKCISL